MNVAKHPKVLGSIGLGLVFAAAGLSASGCSVFQTPPYRADGPTVATGVYHSEAEKWQDETLAAQRKLEKEKTAKELKSLDRN